MAEHLNLKDVKKSRRTLLKKVVKFLPLVGVGAFTYPLFKFSQFQESEKISFVIPLKDIDRPILKKNKVIIQNIDDKITVYDAHCTHMGCILNIDEKKKHFVCPCHNSEFSFNGKRLKGPAKRDLDIINSRIENNMLYIG